MSPVPGDQRKTGAQTVTVRTTRGPLFHISLDQQGCDQVQQQTCEVTLRDHDRLVIHQDLASGPGHRRRRVQLRRDAEDRAWRIAPGRPA
jgi:hypothetical protein